jgi:hypothetical protein
VKRISILLVALLALVVTSCASQQASTPASEAAATPTAEPTPEPTEEPSEAATPGEDPGGSTGGTLEDALPDELNGLARTDVPGMEAFLAPMLAQQGVDASDVEFVISTYGEGDNSITVNAFRIPGIPEASMEALARAMSGVQGESGVTAEPVTVGGKSVLQMTGADVDGAAYLYFADGSVFTIVGPSTELAEQLLSELP